MTSDPEQPVDRCVCSNATFKEMRGWIERHGGDFESLRARFRCGAGCARCVPYVRAMLATGRVRFAVDDASLHRPPPDAGPPPL
jgi:bacterioferritin-associated ferredoxin